MFVRVAWYGRPAVQLRVGKRASPSLTLMRVVPPLSDGEAPRTKFRLDNHLVFRSESEIEAKGLRVIPVPGAAPLTQRLRLVMRKIRPALK